MLSGLRLLDLIIFVFVGLGSPQEQVSDEEENEKELSSARNDQLNLLQFHEGAQGQRPLHEVELVPNDLENDEADEADRHLNEVDPCEDLYLPM